ncbi:MAG: FAD-binding oxidoreductase [Gammaproteobacteria bacterium]|nr:FAD-binding oxidoreductase [Gammaproteobacteria bacterium]
MDKPFDIAIMGAGIVGCLLYYELIKQGRRVALFDKADVASATTGLSGGFISSVSAFTDQVDVIQQNQLYFKALQQNGIECGIRKVGCLLLSNKNLPHCEDIKNLLPQTLNTEIVRSPPHFFYDKQAICVSPASICQQLVARENKKYFFSHHAVERLEKTNNGFKIISNKIEFLANKVIVAAGSGSQQLLRRSHFSHDFLSNKSFQFSIYKIQKSTTIPAIIDLAQQIYIIPQKNNQLLMGFLNRDIPASINTDVMALDEALSDELFIRSCSILPCLQQAELIKKDSAMDAFTKNERVLCCQHPQQENLYLATGCSGMGIKFSPSMVKHLLQLLS